MFRFSKTHLKKLEKKKCPKPGQEAFVLLVMDNGNTVLGNFYLFYCVLLSFSSSNGSFRDFFVSCSKTVLLLVLRFQLVQVVVSLFFSPGKWKQWR